MALTIAYFGAAGIVYVVSLRSTDAAIFFGVAISIYLTQVGEYFCFVLRALRPIRVEAGLAAALSVLYTVGVVGTALVTRSDGAVVASMVVTRAVYAIVTGAAVFQVTGSVRSRFPRWSEIFAELRTAFPVAADIALILAASQLDMLLVGALLHRQQLGVYAAGGRLVMASTILTATVANVFIPLIVTHRERPAIIAQRTSQLLTGLAVLGLVALAGFVIVGPWIVRYVYGSAYRQLNDYWGLFGTLVCLQFWANGFGILLNSYGHQRDRAAIQVIVLPLVALAATHFVAQAGISAMLLIMLLAAATSGYGYFAMCMRRRLLAGVPWWTLAPVLGLAPLLVLAALWRFFVL